MISSFDVTRTVYIDAGETFHLPEDALLGALSARGIVVTNVIPSFGGTYFVEVATVEQREHALSLDRNVSIDGVPLVITLLAGDSSMPLQREASAIVRPVVEPHMPPQTDSTSSSSSSSAPSSLSLSNSEVVVINYVERLVKTKILSAGNVGSILGQPAPLGLGPTFVATWRTLRERLETGERVGRLQIVQRDGKSCVMLSSNVESNTVTRPSTSVTAASSNDDLSSSMISFVERYLQGKHEQKAFVNSVGGEVGSAQELGADRSSQWRTLRDRLLTGERIGKLVYESHADVNSSFICLQTNVPARPPDALSDKRLLDSARTVFLKVKAELTRDEIVAVFREHSIAVNDVQHPFGHYWFVEMATKIDRDIALALDNRLVFKGVTARMLPHEASNDR
jgi:hypothetical protein